MEENLGVVPCTVMSMMSNELLSSACEVDICGVIAMHALQLASALPRLCSTGTTITAPTLTKPCVSIARTYPNTSSAR